MHIWPLTLYMENQRSIFSCEVCLWQIDLMEHIPLQVKPQPMIFQLKDTFWSCWFHQISCQLSAQSVDYSLGRPQPSKVVSSLHWLHTLLWSSVYSNVLDGHWPYKKFHLLSGLVFDPVYPPFSLLGRTSLIASDYWVTWYQTLLGLLAFCKIHFHQNMLKRIRNINNFCLSTQCSRWVKMFIDKGVKISKQGSGSLY